MESRSWPWFEVWQKALLKPSLSTYKNILNRGNPSLGKAFLWMTLSSIAAVFFSATSQNIYLNWLQRMTDLDLSLPVFARSVLTYLFAVPIAALSILIGFALWTGLILLVSRSFGGQGSYTNMAFMFASFNAPLGIITGFLSLIPLINCLNVFLGLYGLVLSVIAIRAATDVNTGKAIFIILIPILIFGVIFGCLTLGILAFFVPITRQMSALFLSGV